MKEEDDSGASEHSLHVYEPYNTVYFVQPVPEMYLLNTQQLPGIWHTQPYFSLPGNYPDLALNKSKAASPSCSEKLI